MGTGLGTLPLSAQPLAITSVTVVADQAARLAMTAQEGDVAIQQDTGAVYMLRVEPATINGNWEDISGASAAPVQSVAGKTGAVTLDTDDVSEATSLYYTEARVTANAAVTANTAHGTSDGGSHSRLGQDVSPAASPVFAGIDIGLGSLRTANGQLLEFNATQWRLRNATDTGFVGLYAQQFWAAQFSISTGIDYWGTAAGLFDAQDVDGAYVAFRARKTGVALQNVARLVGAAEPYLEATKLEVTGNANIAGTLTAALGYTPTTPTDWIDPDPVDVDGALDMLASDLTENRAALKDFRIGYSLGTTADGEHHVIGADHLDASAQQITSALNPTVAEMNRHFFMMEVTTVATAGTVQVQGTSYDQTTGVETPSDTEDVAVSATGWYKTAKRWTSAITIVGLTTTDVTADLYKLSTWSPPGGLTVDLTRIFYHWTAMNSANSLTAKLYCFNFTNRTRTVIHNKTFANIGAAGTPFDETEDFASGVHRINFGAGERLVMHLDTTKIDEWRFGLSFEKLLT